MALTPNASPLEELANKCVAKLQSVMKKNKELELGLEEAESEVDLLEGKNASLEAAAEVAKKSYEELTAKYLHLKEQIKKSSSDDEVMEPPPSRPWEELEDYQLMIRSKTKPKPKPKRKKERQDISGREKSLDLREKKMKEKWAVILESVQKKMEQVVEDTEAGRLSIDVKTKEMASLKSKMSEIERFKEEELTGLSEVNKSLQIKVHRLESSLEESFSAADEAKAEKAKLMKRIQELQDELMATRWSNTTVEAELQALRRAIQSFSESYGSKANIHPGESIADSGLTLADIELKETGKLKLEIKQLELRCHDLESAVKEERNKSVYLAKRLQECKVKQAEILKKGNVLREDKDLSLEQQKAREEESAGRDEQDRKPNKLKESGSHGRDDEEAEEEGVKKAKIQF